jgi:hypothetical protein
MEAPKSLCDNCAEEETARLVDYMIANAEEMGLTLMSFLAYEDSDVREMVVCFYRDGELVSTAFVTETRELVSV